MKSRFAAIVLLLLAPALHAVAQQSILLALRPYPKVAFARDGSFAIQSNTEIVAPVNADHITMRAVNYLNEIVRNRMGFALNVVTPASYGGGSAIVMGTWSSMPELVTTLKPAAPFGEILSENSGGYMLDILPSRATIVGTDAEGIFNAISTLAQLMTPGDASAFVQCSHIWDFPDYPVRWVFSQHNLRGPGQLGSLRSIEDTMAYHKLNGLQQNDFKYNLLGDQPDYYFDSVRALVGYSDKRDVAIIPGVTGIGYSEGILWNDRSLAEGFPASADYVINADTGRLIPDPNVVLPNGNFESVGANGKFTGWSFYDEGGVTADHTTMHGGNTSALCQNFAAGNAGGNCRFSRHVDCKPFHYYRLSAWLKTENLNADMVQLLAIGVDDNNNSRTLTFTQYPSFKNQSSWRQVEVYFNTLGFNHMNLYAGVWGGHSGKIWWDDFQIEDAGLMNVLRRKGTPLTVKNKRTGAVLREGTDIASIHDPYLDSPSNPYNKFHQPPTLRRLTSGAVFNGDTLTVSFFHPLTTIVDADGNGSVMVCVSEDTLYSILRKQVAGVDSLYHGMNAAAGTPDRFFMGHDEIRALGWDSACQRRSMSAAALLGDNVTRCDAIIKEVRPGAERYIWSDMFDSLHNAHNDYYLINGDLTGVWDRIPDSITIVNWNGGSNRDASLDFFNRRHFAQVASPYYDTRNTDNIRAWRLSLQNYPGARGMMYTTWSADYDFLAPFAYYSWGAGPYLIHTPLDSMSIAPAGSPDSSICFRAMVLADPYDPADSITDVKVTIESAQSGLPTIDEIHLTRDTGNIFTGCYSRMYLGFLRYTIVATNSQRIARTSPQYVVVRRGFSGVPSAMIPNAEMTAEPNPASNELSVGFTMPRDGTWRLRLIDLLGNTVLTRVGEDGVGRRHVALDLQGIASGVYRCEVECGEERGGITVRVVR